MEPRFRFPLSRSGRRASDTAGQPVVPRQRTAPLPGEPVAEPVARTPAPLFDPAHEAVADRSVETLTEPAAGGCAEPPAAIAAEAPPVRSAALPRAPGRARRLVPVVVLVGLLGGAAAAVLGAWLLGLVMFVAASVGGCVLAQRETHRYDGERRSDRSAAMPVCADER